MRLHPAILVVPALALVAASRAALGQSVRGTVVDETSKLPVFGVAITLADDAGAESLPGVRTDSAGNFIVHAPRSGTWRVKAMRIGYSPVTSERVSLAVGEVTIVRLRMTTVAQQLVPVQVVERRRLSASELMSTTGFDLRSSRGLGRFLGGERLASMGQVGLREVLAVEFQPVLYILNDSVIGEVIRMRQGISSCAPEIFLDGRLLATAPEPQAVFDPFVPQTALDSVRAQTRAESEQIRLASGQVFAISLLSSLRMDAIYGIEVYRANEVPPPSLGAWFGDTKAAIRSCGTLAVWTKAAGRAAATARANASADRGRVVQVISGTLVDVDTGEPLAGRSVALLTESRDETGTTATTDERGDFTLRTRRVGELRLMAGGDEYKTATTPTFSIAADEMLIVKFFVSTRAGVLAPLGVAARLLPHTIGLTSRAGFAYRRERAQGGDFFRAIDIAQMGARSLAQLVRDVAGVSVTDETIAMRGTDGSTCAPAYYVDGTRLDTPVSLPLQTVFGVEVYAKPAEVPGIFSDAGNCGLIVIWTR